MLDLVRHTCLRGRAQVIPAEMTRQTGGISSATPEPAPVEVGHMSHSELDSSSCATADTSEYLKDKQTTLLRVHCSLCQTPLEKPMKCSKVLVVKFLNLNVAYAHQDYFQCKSVWYCSKEVRCAPVGLCKTDVACLFD